jgi:hypothetical protein
MSRAIPPLPQYAFMAWYSVKAQGQLYSYLYLMRTSMKNKGFKTLSEFGLTEAFLASFVTK